MGAVLDALEYWSPPGPDHAWNVLVRGFTYGDWMAKVAGTLEHMAFGRLVASTFSPACALASPSR